MSELQQKILDCLADLELTGGRFVELQTTATKNAITAAAFHIGVILHNKFSLRHVVSKSYVCVAGIKRRELPGYESSARDTMLLAELRETGSLATVGGRHGLTRERVRQIAAHHGVNVMDERKKIHEAHRLAVLEEKTRRKSPLVRFAKNVLKSDSCWEWIGSVMANGYGHWNVGQRNEYAHRASWRLHRGIVPDGMFVLHKCDNRSCVNPDHLYLGTQRDNVNDRTARGRHRVGPRLAPDEVIRIRHMHFEQNMAISTIVRETNRCFETVKRALKGGVKSFADLTSATEAVQ